MPQSRQLAAILFADIVGYTTLMQHDEQVALEKLHLFKEELNDKVNKSGGQIIQYYGDGCLAIFNNPTDAVQCAKSLQEIFPKKHQVPVRIGIHLGEILIEDGNIFGDSVNIAARIQSMSVPGGVLFSEAIKNQVKNKPEFQFTSLGRFEFKNVDEQMEVFALSNEGFPVPSQSKLQGKFKESETAKPWFKNKFKLVAAVMLLAVLVVAGYFANQYFSIPDTGKSVAVLAFADMSPDKSQEYLGDGLADDIITALSGIKDLKVIGRTSSFQFKGKNTDLREIGEKLNVSAVLEGSVQKSGNRIRVTAQLIDTKDGTHIWSHKWDREITDIFQIQDEIARMIAQKFKIEITPEANAKISQAPTQNVEAYEQFQKGMFFAYKKYFNSYMDEDFEKSKKYFERAIQLDSGFAEAYAGLAEVYDGLRNKTMWTVPKKEFPKELLDLKEKLARKALELKPNSSFVNTAMAWAIVHRQDPNFDSSFFYLKKAFYLDPADPLTNSNLSITLSEDLGLNATAIPLILTAIKADPLDPNNYCLLGKQYALLGKYPEAKKALNKCFELLEGPILQDYNLLFWLVYFGEYEKAANRMKALAWSDSFQISFLYAAKGEPGKISPEQKDNIYILLASNRNKVMKDVINRIESDIEGGYNGGFYNYDFLSNSFYFDVYRNDPDFKRVLAKAKKNHDANMLKYGNIEMPD